MKLPPLLPTLLTSSSHPSQPSPASPSITFNDQIFHDNDSSVCFCAFIANSTVLHLDGITDFYVVEFSRDSRCSDTAYSWNADGEVPAVQDTHSLRVLRVLDDSGVD